MQWQVVACYFTHAESVQPSTFSKVLVTTTVPLYYAAALLIVVVMPVSGRAVKGPPASNDLPAGHSKSLLTIAILFKTMHTLVCCTTCLFSGTIVESVLSVYYECQQQHWVMSRPACLCPAVTSALGAAGAGLQERCHPG